MLPKGGWTRAVSGARIVLMATLLSAAPLIAQEIALPEGITPLLVEQGLHLYHTKGACPTCHGDLGIGAPDGPQLLVGQWKLGPGTFEWLRHMTRHAGWGAVARGGDPQPMRAVSSGLPLQG